MAKKKKKSSNRTGVLRNARGGIAIKALYCNKS